MRMRRFIPIGFQRLGCGHEKNFFGQAFFLKERLKGGENKIMAEIVIRTGKPESIMPVLDSAIRNQLKLLKTSINRTKIRISSFEQKYNMSTEQFMQKIREGMDDDNLDYVEWIGETKILKRLEEEYKELEGLRICL